MRQVLGVKVSDGEYAADYACLEYGEDLFIHSVMRFRGLCDIVENGGEPYDALLKKIFGAIIPASLERRLADMAETYDATTEGIAEALLMECGGSPRHPDAAVYVDAIEKRFKLTLPRKPRPMTEYIWSKPPAASAAG